VGRPAATSAGILSQLGRIAGKRNRLERAEELHKRALKVLEEWGPDRIDVGWTLHHLAELYRGQKRLAEAEPLLRQALGICVRGELSPNHRLVRAVLASLAALYADQGRSADAERLMRGAWVAELGKL
jgi:tetratricopeptide (TPR) repeat protein